MFKAEDVGYFGKVGFGEGIRSEEDWGLFGGSNECSFFEEENWGV